MGAEQLIFSDQTIAMLLAGFAAFASIVALALPSQIDAKLAERLQAVARERGRLREKRLTDLAGQGKRSLRKDKISLLSRFARRLRAEDRASSGALAARMKMAGFRGPGAEALFGFVRTAMPAAFFLGAFAGFNLFSADPLNLTAALAFSFAAAAIGYSLPRIVLDRMIARRQKAISRAFPDALDLLLICVQSGMSVEAALAKVTRDIASQSIELAEELSLTMAELAYLSARWRAYANLGERTGLPAVKLITSALVQAERHGTSISQALIAAAREGRDARAAEAERKAAALPPKLAIPLVAFFLPVLLAIILAPALMQAGSALKERRGSFTAEEALDPALLRPDGASSFHPSASARRGP